MKRAWLCVMVAVMAGCGSGSAATSDDAPLTSTAALDDCRAACATLASCGADATACTTDCTSAAPSLRALEAHAYLTAIAAADNCVQARKQAGTLLAVRASVQQFYDACNAKVAACGDAMVPSDLCAFDDDRPLPLVRDALLTTMRGCFEQPCSTAISACLHQHAGDDQLLRPAFPVLIKVVWP